MRMLAMFFWIGLCASTLAADAPWNQFRGPRGDGTSTEKGPESNAYFYFGRILQSDPVSWIPMGIAAACTFVALAMPTSTPALPFLQRA